MKQANYTRRRSRLVSSAAGVAVLVLLHLSCLTSSAPDIDGNFSATALPSEKIFTAYFPMPDRVNDTDSTEVGPLDVSSSSSSVTGSVPQQIVSLDADMAEISDLQVSSDSNGAPLAGQLQTEPEILSGTEGDPIIKRLPTAADVSAVDDDSDNNSDVSNEQTQTEVSYDIEDSTSTEKPEVQSYEMKSEQSTAKQPTESSFKAVKRADNPWIQKIQVAKSRSLEVPRNNAAAKLASEKPLMLGQVIANVLYGAPWLAIQTNPKCANDMRLYNIHIQNLTMWAYKSE